MNLALPYVFAALCFTLAYVPALWIPDTRFLERNLSVAESDSDESAASQPLLGETNESHHHSIDDSPHPQNKVPSRLVRWLKKVSTSLLKVGHFIMQNRDFAPIVTINFIKSFAKGDDFMLQYVSKRYGWNIAKVGLPT